MNRHSLALVTGATSGIGQALCHLLASQRINLMTTGRNQAHLDQLQQTLGSQVVVTPIQADLAQKEGRERLIAAIHSQAPDLIINNAGFGLYGDCLTYPTQEQLAILEVNAAAVLELTLEGARTLLTKRKNGVILNVSSAAAFQVMPGMAVYAAAKSFVNHFSEAIDQEMAPYGIRILATCPGMVETHFQARASGGTFHTGGRRAGVMSADYVAQQIWEQIERQQTASGYRLEIPPFDCALFPCSDTFAGAPD